MGVGHYENFPVASLLLPAHLRHPVAVIYRFARTADDFADEGDLPAGERLRLLDEFRRELQRIERREPSQDAFFLELSTVIARHGLPLALFHDLLDAFSQDCIKSRYASFEELKDYARRSADPVGRLLLHLFGKVNEETLACSDRICSALQFINFWQDVAIDFAKNRIYLPADEMGRFAVTEAELAHGSANEAFKALMRFQIQRTRTMLHDGSRLGRILKGRIGMEIRMIVAGGDTILQKLLDADCDVFRRRPMLRWPDWAGMLVRAIASDGRMRA